MQVELINPDPEADIKQFKATVMYVFDEENRAAAWVNIIFMSRDELRTLKQQYFKLDVYTDVIAFNLNELEEDIEGEVYLSFEQIKLNAQEFGSGIHEELYRVLIHGCLHLCGYEDDTPQKKASMTHLENQYLAGVKSISI